MAFNGSGTFVRVHSWATDKTNTVPVTASRMDAEDDGMATGLSNCLVKDGQQTATARIPFALGASAMSGTTASVSYGHVNDNNTGIYFPATDQVAISAGGTAVLTATSAGVTITALTVGSDPITNFPAGTVMLFNQTAAPTGWTKNTSTGNDSALRLVTGTVGTGGTSPFTTAFASRTPAGSISGEIARDGHGSQASGGSDSIANTSGGSVLRMLPSTLPLISGAFVGTAMNFAVNYVDIIRATKDA